MRHALVLLLAAGCAASGDDTADTSDTGSDVVNLLQNGSFEADASGWTALNATLTEQDGWLVVTTDTQAGGGHAWQEVTVEAGESLKLSAVFGDATYEGSSQIRAGVSENDDSLAFVYADDTEGEFVATGTTVIITCNNVGDAIGDYAWFDDVVLQRVE